MESPRFSKARFSLQSEQIVTEKRAFLSGHATVCEFGVTTIFWEALLEELKAQVVAAESGHFGFLDGSKIPFLGNWSRIWTFLRISKFCFGAC